MCGISGVVGAESAVPVVLAGLKQLEYRGYDSAGIFENGPSPRLTKAVGKIAALEAKLPETSTSHTAIGHTRWATNGAANLANAHPHYSSDKRFYLVHNGVITNAKAMKAAMSDLPFYSQTDTEVVVQRLARLVAGGLAVTAALQQLMGELQGAYALVIADVTDPDVLYVAKNQSPLVVGLGEHAQAVASDALAMSTFTSHFLALEDGEYGVLTPDAVALFTQTGGPVQRASFTLAPEVMASELGAYPDHMLKEIESQPDVMRAIVAAYSAQPIAREMLASLQQADAIYLVAAGTSYHAGLVGVRLLAELAHKPAVAAVASEFSYYPPLLPKHPAFIFLSQSGETADSLQVLRQVRQAGYPSIAITNAPHSTIARMVDAVLPLHAGPEIAVASTKAYTAQLAVLALLAQALGQAEGMGQPFDVAHQLGLVATAQQTVLALHPKIKALATSALNTTQRAFYIGRGLDQAVSLEAALKLKEISYIQTEGFAAGELSRAMGSPALLGLVASGAGRCRRRTAGVSRCFFGFLQKT